jgi:hypothetical protein
VTATSGYQHAAQCNRWAEHTPYTLHYTPLVVDARGAGRRPQSATIAKPRAGLGGLPGLLGGEGGGSGRFGGGRWAFLAPKPEGRGAESRRAHWHGASAAPPLRAALSTPWPSGSASKSWCNLAPEIAVRLLHVARCGLAPARTASLVLEIWGSLSDPMAPPPQPPGGPATCRAPLLHTWTLRPRGPVISSYPRSLACCQSCRSDWRPGGLTVRFPHLGDQSTTSVSSIAYRITPAQDIADNETSGWGAAMVKRLGLID